jgi:flagellar biogenesis protein FliO
MATLLIAVPILGLLIDIALFVLLIWWVVRILRAAESLARSLGATQMHLDQIRVTSAGVAKQLAG